jgi:type VI secretion system protein ImpL
MKSLFKSVIFWLIAVSLAFLLITVFLGDYIFAFLEPLTMRVLIGFGQFFIVLIALLLYALFIREQMQARLKKNWEDRQARAERKKIVRKKTLLLKQRFKSAIKTIRNSSAYKRKWISGYELPWYLLVGAESEGKTTLLEYSGLDFPINVDYGAQSANDEGCGRPFSWYFAEHAVFVDMPGAYISQSDDIDKEVWRSFLKFFKRWRWRRPINGIILTVSATTLMGKGEKNIEQYAKDLRDRVDDMTNAFMAIIPIYLLVTKLDAVNGFQEYFAALSNEEKDEAFGVTFDEQERIDGVVASREFDALAARINSSVIERMHKEWESAARSKILLFCNEFSSLFGKLKTFIDVGFAKTRYRKPLLLRGVYFTSVPEANERQAVYDGSMLPSPVSARGFFIYNLLADVIFSESDIIKIDESHKKKFIVKQTIAAAFWLSLVLSTLAYWANDYQYNIKVQKEISEGLDEYQKKIENLLNSANITNSIELLNYIYSIYALDDKQYIWEIAFFKTTERQNALGALYYAALEKVLPPKTAKLIEKRIGRNSGEQEALWDNTKAYIMLKEVERRDVEFFKDWVSVAWRDSVEDVVALALLTQHWERLLKRGFNSYPINENVLRAARERLDDKYEDFIYKELKSKIANEPNLKDFKISNLGIEYLDVFDGGNYTIPYFFTKSAYQNIWFTEGKSESIIRNIVKDNWVIGETGKARLEFDQLHSRIRALYFNEYSYHWSEVLRRLKLKPISNRNEVDINRQYSAFIAPNSPMLAILKSVKTNTQIYTPTEMAQKQLAEKGGAIGQVLSAKNSANAEELIVKEFRNKFEAYHNLLKDDQFTVKFKSSVDSVADQYSQVIKLEAFQEKAYKLAYNKAKDDLFMCPTSDLSATPAVKNWLDQACGNYRSYLVSLAKEHIVEQYKTQVYEYYQDRLRDKYPFNKKSSDDVDPNDFKKFFEPKKGGILYDFAEDYITPFKNDGIFNDRFLKTLETATKNIRGSFFIEGDLKATMSLQAQKIGDDTSMVIVGYNNSAIEFDIGRVQWSDVTWPPTSPDRRSELTAYDAKKEIQVSSEKDGDWSLFRTLEEFCATANTKDGATSVTLNCAAKSISITILISNSRAAAFFNKDKSRPLLNFILNEKI